ncbi:hypothetical protein QYF36_020625 [Acer negundo]|nr:hypothetical protein QYF36_020625 [Acer negundo]
MLGGVGAVAVEGDGVTIQNLLEHDTHLFGNKDKKRMEINDLLLLREEIRSPPAVRRSPDDEVFGDLLAARNEGHHHSEAAQG